MKRSLRAVFILFLLIGPLILRAQDLPALEHQLRRTSVSDTADVRRIASEILSIDPYHERATSYFIELLAGSYAGRYRGYARNEAIAGYFKRLIELDPTQPKACYLKAMYMNGGQYRFENGARDAFARSVLCDAVRVDSLFLPANIELGTRYYDDFVRGHSAQQNGFQYDDDEPVSTHTQRRRVVEEAKLLCEFPANAAAALTFLERVWRLDTTQRPLLQHAMLQLSRYFSDSLRIAYYEANTEQIKTGADGIPLDRPRKYFSIQQLMDTVKGESTPHYLYAADRAADRQQWYSEPLGLYQEPILSDIWLGWIALAFGVADGKKVSSR